jgi:transcriptional regulator with XRE-family HTH domain
MTAIASPTDPSVPAIPELPDIGPVLRAARQSRRLSIAEAAGATNVRESYLQALENDDPLDAFPAPVYERFFLREYARFLGVEAEPLVKALEARVGPVEPTVEVPPPAVPPPRRWLGGVLAAAAAGGLIYLGLTSLRTHPVAHPSASGRPTAIATPAPTLPSRPSATPARPVGIAATLKFSAPCWVRASVDGKVLPARTFPAGGSVAFHGRRTLELVLGTAGGVDLRINGKRYRTGRSGQVLTLYFVWRDGHVSSST